MLHVGENTRFLTTKAFAVLCVCVCFFFEEAGRFAFPQRGMWRDFAASELWGYHTLLA